MTVIAEDSNTERTKRSNCNFIRIQNLPWTACRTDIRKFFSGLSMKRGGILVRNSEAFVAFENPNDARLAMYRRNILLHGCKVELSVIEEDELYEILRTIVRRKLDFENTNKSDVTILNFQAPPRRKIRPTPLFKGDNKRFASCSTFIPEETDFMPYGRTVNCSNFAGNPRCLKRAFCGTRKLHPTSVSDTVEGDKLSVFHPEEYCEAKKIKLDV